MQKLSPIVLFTYKRLDTLKNTLSALKCNKFAKDSELIVFSDAARGVSDIEAVTLVRNYLQNVTGFKTVSLHYSKKNKGLANSIIDGVSEVFKSHNSVIVLEDDLITSFNFLAFMNESINKYQEESSVFSISGYSFDLKLNKEISSDSYFLNRGWSWGWATWKDRWESLDWDCNNSVFFKRTRNERLEFAKGGSDLNGMLDAQISGKLDSWAIRWFYNQYKIGGLTLYPVCSKVLNCGFGVDATHTKGSSSRYFSNLDSSDLCNFKYPNQIEISSVALKRFQRKMGYMARIRSKIETFLGI